MMQKRVIVVYDFYELGNGGQVIKKTKWESVEFSKENVLYDANLTYEDNVRNFVSDCVESQAVYIDGKYIPLYNVHGWYFEKQNENNTIDSKTISQPITSQPRHENRRNKFKKIKHRHRNDNQKVHATTTLPFKVENQFSPDQGITNATIHIPEHEDLMTTKLPDQP